MGVTLSEIHQKARHSLLLVRDGLEKLERAESNSSFASSSSVASPRDGANSDLAQFVKRELGQLQNYCAELDRMWRIQLPKGQRDLWKRKVEQVVEEADSLKSGLDRIVGRQHKRQVEAQERAELLQRRSGESAIQIFDDEENAMRSVQRSNTMVEEMLAAGVSILGHYAEQKDRLKSAQRKALDVLNTIGLSNSTLRIIERRVRKDRWVAYGGMIVVLAIVVLFWMWVR